jgi:hypothetical protein
MTGGETARFDTNGSDLQSHDFRQSQLRIGLRYSDFCGGLALGSILGALVIGIVW